MTLVALGRLEVDDALLGTDPAPLDPLLLALARREEDGEGERLAPTGPWRLLRQDGDRADVGAPSEVWGGWVLLHLARTASGWTVEGSSYGVVPGPTSAERSAGLRLVWPADPVQVLAGERWQLPVHLVNDRPERWTRTISPWAPGEVSSGGAPLPSVSSFFLTDVGLEADLAPGEHAVLTVVLLTADPELLPAGDYLLTAQARDLDVVAEPVRLEVR